METGHVSSSIISKNMITLFSLHLFYLYVCPGAIRKSVTLVTVTEVYMRHTTEFYFEFRKAYQELIFSHYSDKVANRSDKQFNE